MARLRYLRLRTKRWPWITLAIVGSMGVTGLWWAPLLFGQIGSFGGLSLANKNNVAGVVSAIVGLLSLLTSLVLGVLQLRQGTQAETGLSPTSAEQRAIELLRNHLGQAKSLNLMGDQQVRALALRIHPAIDLAEAQSHVAKVDPRTDRQSRLGRNRVELDPDLPTFVPRDIVPNVRTWMAGARRDGGFLVLVGNSSVGKTRLLYEMARVELADFVVLAPDLGDGGLVNSLAMAGPSFPRLVLWLDELQRFLPGPQFISDKSQNHIPITATAIRQLLDADTPVVVLGSLWPEHVVEMNASDQDPATDEEKPRYPQAIDIVAEITGEYFLSSFSAAERAAASTLAFDDPRLAQAVADPDFNVTEVLAGARQIMRRYEQAPDTHKAIINAAADARRLGILVPLTVDLLLPAARAYLKGIFPGMRWFDAALAELTTSNRRVDKATAPLISISNASRNVVLGYVVSDYLLQRLSMLGRTVPVPAVAWDALVEHVSRRDDVLRLAASAANRLLYKQAEMLYTRLAIHGDRTAIARLDRMLATQGRTSDLRARADSGDDEAAYRLVDLLAQRGDVDNALSVLRSRASTGHPRSSHRLVSLLVKQRRADELEKLANAGDRFAKRQLATLLGTQRQVDQLRRLADTGHRHARRRLALLLAKQGSTHELQARAEAGDQDAARQFYIRLAKDGRIDELRAMAEAGDCRAGYRLATVWAAEGRVNEAIAILLPLSESGDLQAIQRVATIQDQAGRIDDAISTLEAANIGSHGGAVARQLASLLGRAGRIDDLRRRAQVGDRHASRELLTLSLKSDSHDEAMTDTGGGIRLANLLLKKGRIEEAITVLRERSDTGDDRAARILTDVLAEEGRTDALFDELQAGTPYAGIRLIKLLAERGEVRLADNLRKHGLNSNGLNDARNRILRVLSTN